MRRVEKVDGELYNVEFETIKSVNDPIKAGQSLVRVLHISKRSG